MVFFVEIAIIKSCKINFWAGFYAKIKFLGTTSGTRMAHPYPSIHSPPPRGNGQYAPPPPNLAISCQMTIKLHKDYPGSEVPERPKSEKAGEEGPLAERDKPL